jgi:hypothetical protein
MRIVVLGCLAVAVLVAVVSVVLPDGPAALGQQAPPPRASSDQGLIVLSETVQQQYQQLTVLDPKREVVSIYHVDLATGVIALRSVRNIHWDLQVSDYNGQKPLPREIQALLEQR